LGTPINDNISKKNKQFELFSSSVDTSNNFLFSNTLKVKSKTLMIWRNRIFDYQSKIVEGNQNNILQQSILSDNDSVDTKDIYPFKLRGLSLNFWRTNQTVHNGPAMYFVIDSMGSSQIILYIGETNSANKRWKGVHDCKNYLSNYKEALAYNNLTSQLDIRFFLDVPKEAKLRRKLEQKLIYLWIPPFNKETRDRWSTTFTNN
tara:strand:- start:2729 stop:3340 length:612 start_codon:yes stop_codon:yes gene_type:complete